MCKCRIGYASQFARSLNAGRQRRGAAVQIVEVALMVHANENVDGEEKPATNPVVKGA